MVAVPTATGFLLALGIKLMPPVMVESALTTGSGGPCVVTVTWHPHHSKVIPHLLMPQTMIKDVIAHDIMLLSSSGEDHPKEVYKLLHSEKRHVLLSAHCIHGSQ